MRYAHTNLVARDWRALAQFYIDVLGCEAVSSERNHGGPLFEALTALPHARATGRHLRLPGYGSQGPTLEIFQFGEQEPGPPPRLNRPGLAHLAFAVDDVDVARQRVLAAGGGQLGDLVTIEIPGAGRLIVVYMTDPEGNIVELQRWDRVDS